MAVIKSFRDLEAWQAAMDLSVRVYSVSQRLASEERFGLTSQIRRASVSVPSNVAEGQSHGTNGRYIEHVRICDRIARRAVH
jgi:four helix bundle protein